MAEQECCEAEHMLCFATSATAAATPATTLLAPRVGPPSVLRVDAIQRFGMIRESLNVALNKYKLKSEVGRGPCDVPLCSTFAMLGSGDPLLGTRREATPPPLSDVLCIVFTSHGPLVACCPRVDGAFECCEAVIGFATSSNGQCVSCAKLLS